MLVTLQQLPVLAACLSRPAMGAWAAQLEVDYQNSEETFAGLLELKDAKVTYKGTALRHGIVSGVARLDLVGGRGGIVKPVPARHFGETTCRTVLGALLGAAGETLDPSSSRATLDRQLPSWSYGADVAKDALNLLAAKLEASWRVLPNGNVWFGVDTFPAVGEDLAATLLELDRDDAAGNVVLAPESLELGPGVTLASRRVGRVEHSFGRQDSLRTTFWTP